MYFQNIPLNGLYARIFIDPHKNNTSSYNSWNVTDAVLMPEHMFIQAIKANHRLELSIFLWDIWLTYMTAHLLIDYLKLFLH